ncbi:hypothetical protein KM043_017934 [Ampulex compressa]|nr:hypothetical protein KM043_017934 [Ampulex compressa]
MQGHEILVERILSGTFHLSTGPCDDLIPVKRDRRFPPTSNPYFFPTLVSPYFCTSPLFRPCDRRLALPPFLKGEPQETKRAADQRHPRASCILDRRETKYYRSEKGTEEVQRDPPFRRLIAVTKVNLPDKAAILELGSLQQRGVSAIEAQVCAT